MERRKQGRRDEDMQRETLQEELKASEKRYRDLFERVRQGIIISTRDGRVVDCNQALLDLLGYNEKDKFLSIVLDKDLYVNSDDRKKFQQEVEDKGYVKDYKVLFKKRNGEEISVLMTINPRFNSTGEVIGYQGLIIDITVRERMEKEVREATRRFEKIAEMGNDGIFVFNENYIIEFVNTLASEITGYPREKLIGSEISIFLNKLERRFLAYMYSKVKDDESRKMCMEMEINTESGAPKKVEVCITINKSEGGEVRTYAYTRDITERKKMEKEIREANQFLSNIIECSIDSIVVTDMKGDIIIFNKGAEDLLGYKDEEVIGKMNIRNIYLPGVAKDVMEKMRSLDYGGRGILKSFPIVHKNRAGEVIDGIISASIIYNDMRNEIATVGIFTDLRESLLMEKKLRETQLQLMQSEKLAAMGRLTSQIAHELNNPVYGIMNTLELLKTEVPQGSKRRRVLEMALSESNRVSDMLRKMLTFSKPEEEERSEININRMLEDIILFLEKQLVESNIEVENNFDLDLSPIMASQNQLIQVILNIINNAKDAMPDGGKMTITTFSKNGMVNISIRDTGTGIPENIRDKIFDAFFTTKQAVKGVGLGLSVCYGIIKDHGGKIILESEAGKGSNFTVVLPQAS